MDGSGPHKTAYLTLDEVSADPNLAQRLAPDVAWRYHALPLAEDNGRITVAMADPEDSEARAAVVAALGPRSCVVKGSALAIEARLAEIWGGADRCRLKLGVCDFPESLPSEVWGYAQALGTLLGAQMSRMSTAAEVNALTQEAERADCDLVILGKRRHPLIRRLLARPVTEGVQALPQSGIPFAILVARRPRWPLARILLVICGEGADGAAVDWVARLAQPSSAAVTALAVVPPVPAMYRGLSRMEQSVAALLTRDTALGRQMHHVARCLAECKVDGTLRLRQGAPEQAICREVAEGDHDLIVMATKACQWWLRQLTGDPICSLLSWVDRPLLLTEPTIT